MNITGRVAINIVEESRTLETEARTGLRLKVMRVIEGNPEMAQRYIARELGVSLGGLNSAITAIV